MYLYALYTLLILLKLRWSSNLNTKCYDVVKETKISSICKNPLCISHPKILNFCHHLYENHIKCDYKNIPLALICDGIQHCNNAMDEYPEICKHCQESASFLCLSKNPCSNITMLLDPNNYNIKCFFKNKSISCKELLWPGSQVQISCKSYEKYQILTCQSNGTWDSFPIKCMFTECGLISDDIQMQPMIINGINVERPSSWPWYVSMYHLKSGDNWVFFCSGTILLSNFILTAAHCIWETPENAVKVAAGKFLTDFYVKEPDSQIMNVTRIILHPLYQDSLGNYGSDIALIQLQGHFRFSDYIRPTCINWTLRNVVQDLKDSPIEGKLAGMGITEHGNVSENLRVAEVIVVSHRNCMKNQRYEFKKYVTVSSFCGRSPNRRSVVCNGDSGSGLMVFNAQSSRWYIEGIVSISPKNPHKIICDEHYSTIFTNVGLYVDWIKENIV
ncbi:hypothetical protein ABEB36_013033 [Hypothenemus hampei]|uniref:Peptidase S1 domain-containing protein n=1 Tax=Hypothenemus hampei TaxID=57062 RepID=A0ABD1E6X9_HYPHA